MSAINSKIETADDIHVERTERSQLSFESVIDNHRGKVITGGTTSGKALTRELLVGMIPLDD